MVHLLGGDRVSHSLLLRLLLPRPPHLRRPRRPRRLSCLGCLRLSCLRHAAAAALGPTAASFESHSRARAARGGLSQVVVTLHQPLGVQLL